MISLFYPNIYKDEWLAELSKVFDTRWIGQGPLVDEFEKQFGKKFGYKYCLAVNSGTAALELAYHLVGIGEGDEVLTPVFSCTATSIPLLRRKAKIKFIDINDNLTVSYRDIESKISKHTKAIVVVTLGGIPVDTRIFDLAKESNIPVIIDAAQSLGVSEIHGDIIAYSFQAIKHFTTGDGGMLVLRNEEDYQRAKKLRWFGIDREAKKRANWQWLNNHKMTMDIEEAGYKFHMNDIAATMGIVGLRHSDEVLGYRRILAETYAQDIDVICGGSYWLLAILTDYRDETMTYLREHGIECDLVQIRNDVFKVFGGRQKLPNMDRLESQYLYLPLHPKMSIDDVKYITGILNECKSQLS
jgi:dTDP-4-amino-4,6-dideoxygalactose transaminase